MKFSPTDLKQLPKLILKHLIGFAILMFLIFIPVLLMAQGEDGGTSLDELINIFDFIYGAIVYVIGLFANKFPGINKIPSTWWKIAAIGIAVGFFFILFGWSDIKGLLFAFFATTNIYEAILKLIFPTPKVEGA